MRLHIAYLSFVAVIMSPTVARSQDGFPIEARLGVHAASTKRNTSLSDEITDRSTATVTGLEATLGPPGGSIGLAGRLLSASYANGDFSLKEVGAFIGGEWFRVEAGYGQRSIFATDSSFNFARGGARLMIPIGGSGVTLNASGSKYFAGDFSGTKTPLTETTGWEGETDLFYSVSMIPVYVQLGFRNEYFRQGTRAEHLSGVVLGGGLWLGGR